MISDQVRSPLRTRIGLTAPALEPEPSQRPLNQKNPTRIGALGKMSDSNASSPLRQQSSLSKGSKQEELFQLIGSNLLEDIDKNIQLLKVRVFQASRGILS